MDSLCPDFPAFINVSRPCNNERTMTLLRSLWSEHNEFRSGTPAWQGWAGRWGILWDVRPLTKTKFLFRKFSWHYFYLNSIFSRINSSFFIEFVSIIFFWICLSWPCASGQNFLFGNGACSKIKYSASRKWTYFEYKKLRHNNFYNRKRSKISDTKTKIGMPIKMNENAQKIW